MFGLKTLNGLMTEDHLLFFIYIYIPESFKNMIPCSAFTDAFAGSSLGTNVCTHVLTLLKHSLDKKKKKKKENALQMDSVQGRICQTDSEQESRVCS